MTRSSVDFPQPDGPTKTTNSPSFTSRSMPCSTSTLPKDLRDAVSFNSAMVEPSVRHFIPVEPMPVVMKRCRKTKTSATGSSVTTVIASR